MGMSMSRYLPAMGTAGLERCRVSGKRREPRPPPRITLRTSFMGDSPAAISILTRASGRVSDVMRAPRALWYAGQVSDDIALRPEGALPAAVIVRPGALRRLGAGSWHVLAGFGFLLRRPRLWPLALLPAILTVACLSGGLLTALYAMHRVENALVPGPDKIGPTLGFALSLVVWIGTLISGLVLGLAAALLLSAPVLDLLSLKVDSLVRGERIDSSRGLGWEIWQSFRGTLFFVI